MLVYQHMLQSIEFESISYGRINTFRSINSLDYISKVYYEIDSFDREISKRGHRLMSNLSTRLIGILIIVMLLAGCTPAESVDQRADDELVLAIGLEPEEGFDPTAGWGRYGSPLFQSTLLKRDYELRIYYDLATDYEISLDGLIWTVKLRQDVKFTDGKPLTADDVVFTFQTAAANASTLDLTNMRAVMAIDPYTVQFTLGEPQSTFVTMLVSLGIVPKHLYGNDYAVNPVGSGPYKLVQWDRGQQIIMEANSQYYGDNPHFNKLTLLFLQEDAAYAAAKAGQVDVAAIPSAFGKNHVSGMTLVPVQSVDNRGIMFPYMPAGGTTDAGHPIGNDVTSDIAIRQAINLALDRQQLVDGILEGFGSPAHSIADHLPWWNPETTVQDSDLDRARDRLKQAGWEDRNGEGILERDGQDAAFTLLYPAGDLTRQSLALAAADQVKQIGIKMAVEGKSWEEIGRLMHANAVLLGWGSHDPMEMYHVYSSRFSGVDFLNPGYYSNPVVDQWMDLALRATDEQEANFYWQQAQWDGQTGFSALGDAPWAWLVNIDHLYLVNDRLDIGQQQIQPHAHGWPVMANIEQWQWKE